MRREGLAVTPTIIQRHVGSLAKVSVCQTWLDNAYAPRLGTHSLGSACSWIVRLHEVQARLTVGQLIAFLTAHCICIECAEWCTNKSVGRQTSLHPSHCICNVYDICHLVGSVTSDGDMTDADEITDHNTMTPAGKSKQCQLS